MAVITEHGLEPLVAHAAALGVPAEPWLDALDRYLVALSVRTPSFWGSLQFVVLPVARCVGPEVAMFEGVLQKIAKLLLRLGNTSERTEEHGVSSAASALAGRPNELLTTLGVAQLLAEEGHDPGWYLQLVVPVLAAKARDFETSLRLHATLLHRLSARSVFLGFQVATGLRAIAQVAPDESAAPWLELLARLPAPAAVFEHGVPSLVTRAPPALVTRALELALALASRSLDPLPMLRAPLVDALALDLAGALVEAGIEPSGAMTKGRTVFASLGRLDDGGQRLAALSRRLHTHGLNQRFFEEAVYELELFEKRFGLGQRALELVEALADAGLEPTITLKFGLPRALADVERYPFVAPGALDVALALVTNGVSPEGALSYGLPALVRLAAGDEDEFRRLSSALVTAMWSLHAKGLDANQVLFGDVRGPIEVGGESATFMALSRHLQRVMRVWLSARLDLTPLVQEALPEVFRLSVNRPHVLTVAFELIERLANEGRSERVLPLLAGGLSSAVLSYGTDADGLRAAVAILETQTRSLPVTCLRAVTSAASIVAKRDTTLLGRLLEVMVDRLTTATVPVDVRAKVAPALPMLVSVVTTPRSLETVLDTVFTCIVDVPAQQYDTWLRALEAASSLSFDEALPAIRELVSFSNQPRVLAMAPAVAVLGDTADSLRRGLERLSASSQLLGAGLTFEVAAQVALKVNDLVELSERLDVLDWLLTSATASASLVEGLQRIEPLLARVPKAWAALVHPILMHHSSRAGALLTVMAQVSERFLSSEADCDVLREVITQCGARAVEALERVILPGLQSGHLPGLGSHAVLVRAYLREVEL